MDNKNSSGNKVIKAGAGYIIGNYLLKGITFLSAPIFSRLMTTSDFGDFSNYTSYEAIFYIIVGLALHSSLNNAKYKYGEKFNEYISSLVLLIILSTLGWLFIGNIFFPFYKDAFDFNRLVLNILIIHCMGSSLFQFYNIYASLSYSFQNYLKLTSINAISNMGLSIILMLTVLKSDVLFARIIGMALPIILIGCYIILFFFKLGKPVINFDYWKYGTIYSLPIIPHGISQIILSSFDRIMIKKMVNSDAAGIYSFSYVIYSLFNVTANSLQNVWKPWIYEKMNAKDYATIKKQSNVYALGMALFTILIILVSPEIIRILGDKAYWDSADCVIPVILGGYFAFMYTLPSQIEYFYEKTKFIAIGTVSAAVLNIVLNYIFISRFGYIAAAYTTLVTYFLYFSFHFFLAKRIHGSSLFSFKGLYGVSLVTVAIGLGTILIKDLLIVRWIMALIVGCLSLYWSEKHFLLLTKVKAKFFIK
ncbi:Membrane protein involved in the export of O-antigen and teichoic acid [Acetitomaculum ruminis DSM 5522]|uniref:Membrane protein involved in the export of O-antigen and teichoic acid n=1 Tax=Acetitomaculum ruminis DSM 5522 TaxID=1120918 RepID=A0A1I0Z3T7_9FIRM|nr:oligosaccharide flippase family protein [Acetitomaculum ruminis]SFB19260.1 Membrane protein involved in the export of O-antigen and teichoic acid [Acetitomaculum ruminis DSM 5522]